MTKKKDWKGNDKSTFSTLGASAHSETERETHDFYATDPIAAEHLMKLEKFIGPIWEPACGAGHLSEVFKKHGYSVLSSDIVDRGYGSGGIDFLSIENQEWNGDVITNPPYIYAEDFIYKSLQIIPEGHKVAMFLRVLFMESISRKELFRQFPPLRVYVSSSRIVCAKNGDFDTFKRETGGAMAYAWFVWEKGYKGETVLKWFN